MASDRLLVPRELLGRLAPEEPINDDERGGCVWCGGMPPCTRYAYATVDPRDHTTDCPWVAARALLEKRKRS